MKVQENPAAARELIQRANDFQQTTHPREAGLHVSDLIYCRRKSWYRRQLRESGQVFEEYDTDTLAMFLLGHGYHALLEQGIEERKIVLRFVDPATDWAVAVHGTVDHMEPGLVPHEFKTTRASSSKAIDSVQHYIEQVASYCLGVGSLQGRLSVVYINGSYNKDGSGMKPTIKTYDLEFATDELAAWKLELGHRVQVLLQPTPPPLPCHRTWECGYCPFSVKAGGPCSGGPGEQRHWFMQDTLPDFLEDVLDVTN